MRFLPYVGVFTIRECKRIQTNANDTVFFFFIIIIVFFFFIDLILTTVSIGSSSLCFCALTLPARTYQTELVSERNTETDRQIDRSTDRQRESERERELLTSCFCFFFCFCRPRILGAFSVFCVSSVSFFLPPFLHRPSSFSHLLLFVVFFFCPMFAMEPVVAPDRKRSRPDAANGYHTPGICFWEVNLFPDLCQFHVSPEFCPNLTRILHSS